MFFLLVLSLFTVYATCSCHILCRREARSNIDLNLLDKILVSIATIRCGSSPVQTYPSIDWIGGDGQPKIVDKVLSKVTTVASVLPVPQRVIHLEYETTEYVGWPFPRNWEQGYLKEVPLSRMFLTTLVRAHEAGDACVQSNKRGGHSAEPKEPSWIRHCSWTLLKDTPDMEHLCNEDTFYYPKT